MFSVRLMQPWIYNLVLTSAEGGIKNSLMPGWEEDGSVLWVGMAGPNHIVIIGKGREMRNSFPRPLVRPERPPFKYVRRP